VIQRICHIRRGAGAAKQLAVALPAEEGLLRQPRKHQVQKLQRCLVHDDQKSANEAQVEQGEEGDPVGDQLENVVQLVAEGGVVAVEEDLQELDDHDEGHHRHLEGFGDEVVEGLGPGPDDDTPGRGVVRGGRQQLPGRHWKRNYTNLFLFTEMQCCTAP
jgi:hypothetical protein